MNILEHVKSRHLELDRYTVLGYDEDSIDFALWNLSGQMVGYQRYRPEATKKRHNDEFLTKYYTYYTNKKTASAFGMETLSYRDDLVYITEGVFDAARLHSKNLPALAVLSNNPVPLYNFLSCLPRTKIVVPDNDTAGFKLTKYGTHYMKLPDGYKDLSELPEELFCTYCIA